MASTRVRCPAVGLTLAVMATLLSIGHGGSAAAPPADHPLVARQDETGKVGFIGAMPGRPFDVGLPDDASPAAVARAFLRRRADQLGLGADRTGLRVVEQHATAGLGRAVRITQEYAGIPVLGGQFTVNLDRHGDVLSVLGEASPITVTRTRPVVTGHRARAAAIAAVAKGEGLTTHELTAGPPTLTYYDPRLLGAPGAFQTARLSWLTEVRSAGAAVSHTVVVDAERPRVSLDFSNVAHAKDRRVCDANNTTTQYPCESPQRTEISPPSPGDDTDVRLAFDYSGDTYDFFSTRFGRDSLDGAGMPLVSTVDWCPAVECPDYANAFWDGSQMVFGDGFASADDVVGHELAHGFTDFSSSLFYYSQSGAINEAMSDILGELIDLDNSAQPDPGTDTAGVRWLMGEDLPIGAIRDMQDPPAYDQPDRMGSPRYTADEGEDDGGGVHTNSGVANKAAYLLVDGDTFNGHVVSPIGSTKTARLFYTVNNDLLVSGSDYADLARALRQACINLVSADGIDGFTTADCAQVDQALLATEMDQDPAQAPTTDPRLCPPGDSPVLTMHDDLETPSGQFTITPLVGPEVWSYPQNPNDYAGFDATYATSGTTNIWGDGLHIVSDSALEMATPVTVPTGGLLHFRHAHGFEDDAFDTYDGGVLEFSAGGGGWQDAGPLFVSGGYNGTIATLYGNPLGGRAAFVAESNGYGSSLLDLSGWAGQSMKFRWRIGTDAAGGDYGWFIDDLSVYQCVVDTTPPDTIITGGPAEGSATTLARVTFRFLATEPNSTFACSLDGAASPCSSPRTWSGLSLGTHTFRVAATDAAGNTDPTPATRTFIVEAPPTPTSPPPTSTSSPPAADVTAPNTKITKKPKKRTFSRRAKLVFKSTESGSTFQCKLDRGKWKSCTSPKKYQRLKPGRHRFAVRATDGAGNVDSTPARARWVVRRR